MRIIKSVSFDLISFLQLIILCLKTSISIFIILFFGTDFKRVFLSVISVFLYFATGIAPMVIFMVKNSLDNVSYEYKDGKNILSIISADTAEPSI